MITETSADTFVSYIGVNIILIPCQREKCKYSLSYILIHVFKFLSKLLYVTHLMTTIVVLLIVNTVEY